MDLGLMLYSVTACVLEARQGSCFSCWLGDLDQRLRSRKSGLTGGNTQKVDLDHVQGHCINPPRNKALAGALLAKVLEACSGFPQANFTS